GQESEIRDPILRKECGQHHDHDGAHNRSDHPEPAFAQRSAELWLADDRRGGAGPKRIVEFEPEGDEQSQTNGRPKSQAKKQRLAIRAQTFRQALAEWNRLGVRMHLTFLRSSRAESPIPAGQCCKRKSMSSAGLLSCDLARGDRLRTLPQLDQAEQNLVP